MSLQAQEVRLRGLQPRVLHPVAEQAADDGQQVEVAGMDRGRAPRACGSGRRGAASRSRARCRSPARRPARSARPSAVEQRRARRRGRAGAAGPGGTGRLPTSRARSGTRPCRPPWPAPSSPCRGRPAGRPAAADRAAWRAARDRSAIGRVGPSQRTNVPDGVRTISPSSVAASRSARTWLSTGRWGRGPASPASRTGGRGLAADR